MLWRWKWEQNETALLAGLEGMLTLVKRLSVAIHYTRVMGCGAGVVRAGTLRARLQLHACALPPGGAEGTPSLATPAPLSDINNTALTGSIKVGLTAIHGQQSTARLMRGHFRVLTEEAKKPASRFARPD